MADVLKAVLPEPVLAGKNVPLDTGAGGTSASASPTCTSACKRVISDCLVETLMAMGQFSPKVIANLRQSGMLDKIRASGTKTCQQACSSPGKNYDRVQAMIPCAKKRSCAAVGACAAKFMK